MLPWNHMQLDYIDIHSHLNLAPLTENHEPIIARMRDLKVGTITVGTGLETSRAAVQIAEKYPDVCWATVGFHPCADHAPDETTTEGAHEWEEVIALARHEKVVAIGETGLDYFHENTEESRAHQVALFKKHISLAVEAAKPLMLHVRSSKGSDDAYYDALTLLKEVGYMGSANFHFFSGSTVCMQAIIEAGYMVSVDGPITFVSEYDDMIRAVPLDKIMVETDAPYAAPKPYRGKPCEPWMVTEIAQRVADLKEMELDVVIKQLRANTQNFFGI